MVLIMLVSKSVWMGDNTTPVKIIEGSDFGEYVAHIQTIDPVMIGGSDITNTYGLHIASGYGQSNIFTIRVQGEDLWAVPVGSAATISVLVYSA